MGNDGTCWQELPEANKCHQRGWEQTLERRKKPLVKPCSSVTIIITDTIGASSRELLGDVGKKGLESEGLTLNDVETEETAFVICSVFVVFLERF